MRIGPLLSGNWRIGQRTGSDSYLHSPAVCKHEREAGFKNRSCRCGSRQRCASEEGGGGCQKVTSNFYLPHHAMAMKEREERGSSTSSGTKNPKAICQEEEERLTSPNVTRDFYCNALSSHFREGDIY